MLFVVLMAGDTVVGVGQSGVFGHFLSRADSGGVRGQLGDSTQRLSHSNKITFVCSPHPLQSLNYC